MLDEERLAAALGDGDGDDLLCEAALLGRRRGALVAERGELVHRLARDARSIRIRLRGGAHRDVLEGAGEAVGGDDVEHLGVPEAKPPASPRQ
jgi:hypothetical protein